MNLALGTFPAGKHMEMGSPVVQDRDRTTQQGWGTGTISLWCLRPVTESLTLAVPTSPVGGQRVQPAFSVGQGLGQQGPESPGVHGTQHDGSAWDSLEMSARASVAVVQM